MEFPELGKHCSFAGCGLLDFLPFECDKCHQVFCNDHRVLEAHNCSYTSPTTVRAWYLACLPGSSASIELFCLLFLLPRHAASRRVTLDLSLTQNHSYPTVPADPLPHMLRRDPCTAD